MNLIQDALDNHIAAIVAAILVVLFGLVSLSRLPVQLTPEIERPKISINTSWRAAAPEEVEAEIIEPREKVLRGLPGMTELESEAQRGRARVTVTFAVGSDLQRGLVDVLNRLNRVSSYPDDADEPVLSTVGGRSRGSSSSHSPTMNVTSSPISILSRTWCRRASSVLPVCPCPRCAADVRWKCA